MKLNKTRVFILLFVVIGATIISYFYTQNYKSRVTINGKTYTVDVSDTAYTLSKGLSGRKSIRNNEGMIFVFEKPDTYGFWMKDMNFPIDIIWIDENLAINHIEKSLSPSTYPNIFEPETPSKYVLEIASGQADLIGAKIGDKVGFLYKNAI